MMDEALVYECALDATPEKVWRALTIPEYLERWLAPDAASGEALDLTVLAAEENKSLSYHWREAGQGAVGDVEDSVVTFELKPMADGRTWFRLTHEPVVMPVAANSNLAGPLMMLAA